MIEDPYNAETRRLFSNPVHAGDIGADHDVTAVADAAESAAGARIRLAVGVTGGIIREFRYRVFGCPHLIAAAEWASEQLEGREPSELAGFSREACMQKLRVPVGKTGRIILLEDALGELDERLRVSN